MKLQVVIDVDSPDGEIPSELSHWGARPIDGKTTDGYHSFDELYRYRLLYNAALFNEWASESLYTSRFHVHKSWRHNSGEECFGGGWFIVMAELPTGQISNHYEEKYWDLFQIPERDRADEWDGHTPADAADRLYRFLMGDDRFLMGDDR